MSDTKPDLFRPLKGQTNPDGKACRGLSQDGFPEPAGGECCECKSHCEWMVRLREEAKENADD